MANLPLSRMNNFETGRTKVSPAIPIPMACVLNATADSPPESESGHYPLEALHEIDHTSAACMQAELDVLLEALKSLEAAGSIPHR